MMVVYSCFEVSQFEPGQEYWAIEQGQFSAAYATYEVVVLAVKLGEDETGHGDEITVRQTQGEGKVIHLKQQCRHWVENRSQQAEKNPSYAFASRSPDLRHLRVTVRCETANHAAHVFGYAAARGGADAPSTLVASLDRKVESWDEIVALVKTANLAAKKVAHDGNQNWFDLPGESRGWSNTPSNSLAVEWHCVPAQCGYHVPSTKIGVEPGGGGFIVWITGRLAGIQKRLPHLKVEGATTMEELPASDSNDGWEEL